MTGLLLAVVAAGLVVTGAVGVRLLRTTGLEGVVDVGLVDGAQPERVKTLLVDRVGIRFQRVLLAGYGPARLSALDARLRRAGRPEGLTVTTFVQRQAGFIVLGIVAGALFVIIGHPVPGAVLAVAFAGWMDLWLSLVSRARVERIDRELPDFLDVLGVTVTAGLSFRQAIERITEFHDGPLAQEMQTALREMSVGVTRREAFRSVRERTRSEPVAQFVTAILQAEELGVPLSQALRDIAGEARRERAQRVRQQAAKAGPKVGLVVTTTILPGAIILMVAGLLLANRDALEGLFG